MSILGRWSLAKKVAICVGTFVLVVCVVGYLAFARYLTSEDTQAVKWDFSTDLPAALQRGLDAELTANPGRNAAALYVIAPGLDLDVGFVTGFADPGAKEPMTLQHEVRVASVTKSYVAAAAFALEEQGVLSLQASVRDSVSPELVALLEADGYDVDKITLFHLISHRSGIPDYASHRLYQAQIVGYDLWGSGPEWTVHSQLEFALKHGDPLFEPGAENSYSDTGYILLGNALENATGQDLATAVRTAIGFEALGLTQTWWEKLEAPEIARPRARQFVGTFDASNVDASIDLFGGGGLVATQRDVAHGIRAIVAGSMFAEPETKMRMRVPTERHYGAGLYRMHFTPETCFGHGGYWGLLVAHCPGQDITVALTYTQANAGGQGRTLNEILKGLVARQEAQ